MFDEEIVIPNDLIDWEAEIDSTLTKSENRKILKEKYSLAFKKTKSEIKSLEEKYKEKKEKIKGIKTNYKFKKEWFYMFMNKNELKEEIKNLLSNGKSIDVDLLKYLFSLLK